MNNVKIKFRNGKITGLRPLIPNDKPKKFLEKITGLKYGNRKDDIYPQTVGLITAFMCNHSPDDEQTPVVFATAQMVIGKWLSEKTGGTVCITDEDGLLVYSPNPEGHFIVDCQIITDGIIKGNWDYSKAVKRVKTIDEPQMKDPGHNNSINNN